MTMPERAGIYRAEVTDAAAGRNKNGRWQVVFQFMLTQELDGDAWRSAPQDWTIRTWQQLQKRDDSINERTVENLVAAFGWPGDNPFWFEDELTAHGLPAVQLVIGADGEYNGQPRYAVKWINHHDREPGGDGNGELQHADQNERRQALAEIGSQLRALRGAETVEAPARRQTPPPPADEPPASGGMTEQEVWDLWCDRAALEGIPHADRNDLYNAAIRDAKNPGQVGKDLSPQQWARVDALLSETLAKREAEARRGAEG